MQEDLTTDETLNEDQQGFTVSDDFITRLREELNAGNFAEVREECLPLSPADTAEILSKIDFDHALQLVDVLGEDMSSDVYAYLDNDLVTRMFANMSDWDVASIINQMESDDALDLIEDLDEETQGKILLTLSSKMRAALEEGLTFPEDSAGRLMQRTMVAVPQFWTVGKTLDYLRVAKDSLPDNFYDIIIVDAMHHVVGEVPAGKILKAQRTARMSDLALDNFHPVKAETDQEDVAHLFISISIDEGSLEEPVIIVWDDGEMDVCERLHAEKLVENEDSGVFNFIHIPEFMDDLRRFLAHNQDAMFEADEEEMLSGYLEEDDD